VIERFEGMVFAGIGPRRCSFLANWFCDFFESKMPVVSLKSRIGAEPHSGEIIGIPDVLDNHMAGGTKGGTDAR
jgi:hypothetical protein